MDGGGVEAMPDLIPEPRYARFAREAGECVLDDPLLDAGPGTGGTARWLRRELGAATGWDLPAPPAGETRGGRAVIRLALRPERARTAGAESYELHVTQRWVLLEGADPAGLFYAAQTLRQLLGPEAHRRGGPPPPRPPRRARRGGAERGGPARRPPLGGAAGRPAGSLPLWAAALGPAAIWAVLVAGAVLWRAARRLRGAVLAFGGVLLAGAQASIVRANLHHSDWHDADPVTVGAVVTVVAALAAGAVGALVSRRTAAPVTPGQGPRMDVPEGERRVWLSRTANPWLSLLAAVTGVVALVALLVGVAGPAEPMWMLILPFAVVSLAVLACSSVRVRVGERGLDVAFGPLGWPVRHWDAADVEWARAENRTPAQVGGWGYRLSGLGVTVMLRSGACLVIRSGGKDFAVSVDDAERGAALLNSLAGSRARRP
ncbi:glycoside hydrolase family 20 zincin-like fold domain-containing protein [Streptomyces sp. NPDC059456]|uniref:glycoside hydrolase family 20 zincin-like fold domain-containing protein n=1 Tax=Streptomyces sp. NPDC059456 TaxID=3346838 RepID=UPI00367FCBB3